MDKIAEFIKMHLNTIAYLSITILMCTFQVLYFNDYTDYLLFENIIYSLLGVIVFYQAIFHRPYKQAYLKLGCLAAIIIAANRLYSYKQLLEFCPGIATIRQSWIIVGTVGIVIVVLMVVKLIKQLLISSKKDPESQQRSVKTPTPSYDAAVAADTPEELKQKSIVQSSSNRDVGSVSGQPEIMIRPSQGSKHSTRQALVMVLVTMVALSSPIGIIYLLMNTGVKQFELGYEGDFKSLINIGIVYVVSVFVVIALILFVAVLVKSVCKYIMPDKTEPDSKERRKADEILLYFVSMIIAVIIMYLSVVISGLSLDGFLNKFTLGDYLIVPLSIIMSIVFFSLLVQIIHGIIVALPFVAGHDIENDKFGKRVADMIDLISDILLSSIEAILKFVQFIPNFFIALSIMVLGEESNFNCRCSSVDDKSDLKETAVVK